VRVPVTDTEVFLCSVGGWPLKRVRKEKQRERERENGEGRKIEGQRRHDTESLTHSLARSLTRSHSLTVFLILYFPIEPKVAKNVLSLPPNAMLYFQPFYFSTPLSLTILIHYFIQFTLFKTDIQ